jgi:glycosyltransferase
MRMGGLSTSISKQMKKWKEDLLLYRSHGFNPYIALAGKILSKIPQFISTMVV